ncbi:MAG: Gfo/Idh/MocA family protein [Rhodospirillaceae bacterium]
MSSAPYQTCIVGFGRISSGYADDPIMARHYRYTTHAQVLRVHPRFAWNAVVDPSPDAQRAAKTSGIADVATSAAQLTGRAKIEVAVLATPPGPSRFDALEALPALRAVVVEKPLGRSLAEAQEFLKRCEDRKVTVQVNLWRRSDETLRRLAAGELEARIGRLQTGTAFYGNGARNNGVHLVDMVRMLCGEIANVAAFGPGDEGANLPIPGDRQISGILTLASGARIMMSALDFRHYREVGLDLWGETGRLTILQEGLLISHYPREANRAMQNEREIASDQPRAIVSTVGEAFWHVYENLASALDGNSGVYSPAESALRSEGVIEALFQSAKTSAPVLLGP